MLHLLGHASRPAATIVYGLGVLSLVFAIRRHPRSRGAVSRGRKSAGTWFAENRGAVASVLVFIACGCVLLVLVPPGRAEIELVPPRELESRLDRDVERVLTSAPALEHLVAATGELFHDPDAPVNVDKRLLADALHGQGEHGPPRVIEAISEGVSVTSLEHSAGADYVAVLRPKLDRTAKLGALVRAYAMWGRRYDFDFDFVTDSSIVCSELVYKAYRAAEGRPGLRFELSKTADRLVLPPNDLVRKFDVEYGSPNADFDFVAFLDGSEREKNASFRDAAALRESWRRPKWDVLQE